MADYELSVVAGNLGRDPEVRETTKGPVVSVSIAQPVKFSKDAPDPTWFNGAIWDKGLQNVVLGRNGLKKGDRVSVFGKRKPDRHVDGKTYRDIDIYRIGKVDYLFPLDNTPTSGPRQAPDADDDLPF